MRLNLKTGKLNSQKYKKSKKAQELGIEEIVKKDLYTYYNRAMTQELYEKQIEKIFGKEDFYRKDEAQYLIRINPMLKQSMKAKLVELIELVNEMGYTKASEEWSERYSLNTFNNHKKKLELLGINILTYDKKIKGTEILSKKVSNFALLANGVQEIIDNPNI